MRDDEYEREQKRFWRAEGTRDGVPLTFAQLHWHTHLFDDDGPEELRLLP